MVVNCYGYIVYYIPVEYDLYSSDNYSIYNSVYSVYYSVKFSSRCILCVVYIPEAKYVIAHPDVRACR